MPEPGTPALACLLASKRCFHGYDDDEDLPMPIGPTDSCSMAVHTKLKRFSENQAIWQELLYTIHSLAIRGHGGPRWPI